MPLVVSVFVLIAVVPDTERLLMPVTVSVAWSPNTALPVMVSAFAPPATVPLNVAVVAVKAVPAPSVALSL